MPDVLAKLFGSQTVVKILRLFLLNSDQPFDKDTVVCRTKSHPDEVGYELSLLTRIGVLKKKSFVKVDIEKDKHGVEWEVRRRMSGWILSDKFPYIEALRALLLEEMRMEEGFVAKRLSKVGTLRLVVVSGVFTDAPESRLDLLIVADRVRENMLDTAIHDVEAWAGKEMRFATLSLSDFRYRRNIQDRLVRDVFDYSHRIVLNRGGI
jgi:hypothetical protein